MEATSSSLLFNSAVRLMAICGESRQTKPVAKATAQEGDLGSGYRSNRSRRSLTLGGVAKHLQILALIVLALFLNRVPLQAQPSPPSRPVLFVHGWCGSAYDWAPFFDPNNKYGLPALLPASIYPNQDVYLVEYNRKAKTIGFWKEESPQSGSQTALTYVGVAVPSDVRLFALNFIDPNPSSTNPVDPVNVARSSVLNKAYEIAVVAQYIEQLTYSKQINIIAHSLGGLDARAYVENMASAGDCYDYGSNPGNSFPDYGVTTSACLPGYGPAAYAGDVANIITLDTPHNGSPLANSWQAGLAGLGYTCQSTTTTNSYELVPNNVLLNTLNYSGLGLGNNVKVPDSLSTRIQAIEDYDSEAESTWTGLSGALSDDIVPQTSQSIQQNVLGSDNSPYLKDISIPYSSATIDGTSGCSAYFGFQYLGPMIHNLSCLGALSLTGVIAAEQLTNNTVPWISSWSVTPSSVSLGNSFTIQFTATDLSTSTLSSAQFWRAPDANGQPGTWTELTIQQLSGNGPSPVTYTDKPPTTGAYWYGTELRDSGGNGAWEQSSSPVVVSSGSTSAFALAVNSSNPSNGVPITTSPSDNSGLGTGNTSFSLTYNQNAKVTLTAPATAGGNSFASWTGCDQPAAGVKCTVTMTSAKAVTANYSNSAATYRLTVNSSNPSSGVTVIASPADNNEVDAGPTSVTFNYNQNAQVTLTAPATAGGNSFASWTGCDLAVSNSCTVTLTASRVVTANYATSTSTTQTAHFSYAQLTLV